MQKIRRRSFIKTASAFTLGLGAAQEPIGTLIMLETQPESGRKGKDNHQLTYMLRRVLCPWKWEEVLDETVEWCLRQKVDEIMWITESSGMYKELPPLTEIHKIIERLVTTKKRTEKASIAYSINPLTTIGHGDYGNDVAANHPGLEMMVDFRGGVSRSCACPLSPVWIELMRETFALYASTRPVRLWLEDDFRYINHLPNVRYGCYCPRHLDEFSHKIGKSLSREELVDAILKPGEPHPWRTLWYKFLEEEFSDLAVMIRQAVHRLSPKTQMGIMTYSAIAHQLEGKSLGSLVEALAGDGHAAIRLGGTLRLETGCRDILRQDENLKHVVAQIPADTTRCVEIETIPHSAYSASAAFIGAQIKWSSVLAVPNQTMNIFDYNCTPLSMTPTYDDMLGNRKNEFSSYAETFAELKHYRGIGIPLTPTGARKIHTSQGKDMRELMVRGEGWAEPLRAFGMPIHFTMDESVTAVTGQSLRCMTEEQMTAIFSRGVLLDASALQTLYDMGRSDLAGVQPEGIIKSRENPVGSEELTDPDFAGGPYHYTWIYGSSEIAIYKADTSAKPISRIVDPDGNFLCQGILIFENSLGGRVATVPYFCQGTELRPKGPPKEFYTPYRRQQFHALIRWLGRDQVPLIVKKDGWTLPHRADGKNRTGLAVMNINSDTWTGVEMQCWMTDAVQKVEWLDTQGNRWELDKSLWHQEGEQVFLTVNENIPPLMTVACILML